MGTCWAKSIDTCKGNLSREHVISRSIFITKDIQVHGLHWCKDEPKIVSIESLTSRILCEKHNNNLSPLDYAAGNAYDVFRQEKKLCDDRAKLPANTRLKIEKFNINAKLLERWFLKTLINISLSCGSDYLIGTDGTEVGIPPDDLVQICCGQNPFPGKAGMYVAGKIGSIIHLADTFAFSPLIKDDKRIMGGFFEFYGYRILLTLMPEGVQFPLSTLPGVDPSWINAELIHPIKKIKIQRGDYLSHVIKFDW